MSSTSLFPCGYIQTRCVNVHCAVYVRILVGRHVSSRLDHMMESEASIDGLYAVRSSRSLSMQDLLRSVVQQPSHKVDKCPLYMNYSEEEGDHSAHILTTEGGMRAGN